MLIKSDTKLSRAKCVLQSENNIDLRTVRKSDIDLQVVVDVMYSNY